MSQWIKQGNFLRAMNLYADTSWEYAKQNMNLGIMRKTGGSHGYHSPEKGNDQPFLPVYL